MWDNRNRMLFMLVVADSIRIGLTFRDNEELSQYKVTVQEKLLLESIKRFRRYTKITDILVLQIYSVQN